MHLLKIPLQEAIEEGISLNASPSCLYSLSFKFSIRFEHSLIAPVFFKKHGNGPLISRPIMIPRIIKNYILQVVQKELVDVLAGVL